MQIIDPFYDPDAVISKAARGVKKGEVQVADIINPLEGKFALADTVEALENIKTSFLGDGMAAQLYQNLILYLREGITWMKKKYKFQSKWDFSMHIKKFYDKFFQKNKELLKYKL